MVNVINIIPTQHQLADIVIVNMLHAAVCIGLKVLPCHSILLAPLVWLQTVGLIILLSRGLGPQLIIYAT